MTNNSAVIREDGTKIWEVNGVPSRTDGPAIIYPDGSQRWYLNGKLHREDGPAINNSNGYKAWYLNDVFHRTDGPAVIRKDGSEYWFVNGICHRDDGSASITYIFSKSKYEYDWYINGNLISKEVNKWMKNKGYRWSKNRKWSDSIISDFLLTFS